MSARDVVIVDYGVGNLLSVARAVEKAGGAPLLSGAPQVVGEAERLIVPGVGAFGDCAAALKSRGLDDAVRDYIARERPMLGICVGMQLLFDKSLEFGETAGLGVISGPVAPLPTQSAAGAPLKIPRIGWLPLLPPAGAGAERWRGGVLGGFETAPSVYFVHSFAGRPERPEDVLAEVDFGGWRVCAAVQRGSAMGAQFHPEKSGPAGLAMIDAFLRL